MLFDITDVAAEEIKKLLADMRAVHVRDGKDPNLLFLRVGIAGGGCSGFSYLLEFATKKEENDEELEIKGVRVVMNKLSSKLLNGAVLDYIADKLGSRGFTFINPNEKSRCGCGQSFQA